MIEYLEDGGEAAVAPTLPSLTVLYNSTVSTSERGAFLLQCLTINKELVLGEREALDYYEYVRNSAK